MPRFHPHGLRIPALLLVVALAASGCALPLPQPPIQPDTYDLGPIPDVPPHARAAATPVAVPTPDAPAALDGTYVSYRMPYAGSALQTRPYAYARWIMPPAQLLGQRLRTLLAATRPVLDSRSTLAPWHLEVELDEFTQVFTSASQSNGVVRLRATLVGTAEGKKHAVQRTFSSSMAAHTPDAPGGIAALRDASDDVLSQLVQWVGQQVDPR